MNIQKVMKLILKKIHEMREILKKVQQKYQTQRSNCHQSER
ncbi:hypothetical protein V054_02733 [Staphylococcus aureus MSSA-47]|nr:hypothetical protein Y002_14115 [Staphylococcus aureus MUM270]EZT39675.1 hypothetical protein V054_02733 [Staphylococcus aureus MSSA-47]EZT43846.1 hypothetical protein V053_02711 [Staphylococcus aureus MSSA-37]EZT47374.1 hypothetical protein V056_02733 [Staphylococcus aureus MSSA-123]EZY35876.1 hypothetical protein V055_02725 [Staphylococcus aureus MRSA-118]EZY40684.1 hypothetical protein V057_02750 [Staphylococcus aureus MRSA-136]EZZ41829.1 hypothetical protein V112_02662 [Staphylococcus 